MSGSLSRISGLYAIVFLNVKQYIYESGCELVVFKLGQAVN